MNLFFSPFHFEKNPTNEFATDLRGKRKSASVVERKEIKWEKRIKSSRNEKKVSFVCKLWCQTVAITCPKYGAYI